MTVHTTAYKVLELHQTSSTSSLHKLLQIDLRGQLSTDLAWLPIDFFCFPITEVSLPHNLLEVHFK
jgi:hypothetical protein